LLEFHCIQMEEVEQLNLLWQDLQSLLLG